MLRKRKNLQKKKKVQLILQRMVLVLKVELKRVLTELKVVLKKKVLKVVMMALTALLEVMIVIKVRVIMVKITKLETEAKKKLENSGQVMLNYGQLICHNM